MAFVLKKTGINTFRGTTGQTFTIVLTVDKGILTGPLARYDGQAQNSNPFSFPVGQTEKNLVMSYVGTDPNGTVTIAEKDGAATNRLTSRPVSDGMASLRIEVAAGVVPPAVTKKKAAIKKAAAKKSAAKKSAVKKSAGKKTA